VTELEQKEFLVKTMVSLLKRTLEYQSLVEWLTTEVGVPKTDLAEALKNIREEVGKTDGLQVKLRTIVESALQSGEADYDLILASSLAQWKPDGKAN